MTLIAFLLLAVACLADAFTTSALINRGGVEKNLAWLIGSHPDDDVVYIVIAVVPIAICAGVLVNFPTWWPAVVLIAIWRLYQAGRNHLLQRT